MADSNRGGSRIGKKLETREDLAAWVREAKDRERERHRLVWIDWINVMAAFHNRPDLRAGEDFMLVKRLSKRQSTKLQEVAVNYVQPHARTLSAKLQKARPILEVVPSTTDEPDIQAAKVGDRLLKSEWQEQEMDLNRLEMALWVANTGNAFWHVYYDPSAGPIAEAGIPIGQIRTECISPFKVVFEPYRTQVQQCRWCIITQKLPIDQVQAQYAKIYAEQNNGEELVLSPSDTSESGAHDIVTESYLSFVGIGDARKATDSDYIDVDILYHLPTQMYPPGFYSIIAGAKVLYTGPFPQAFATRLPIFHFREILAPWRLYGDSGTIQVLNTQDAYNEMRLLEKRYHRAGINQKLMVPEGCRLKIKRLASGDNEVIYYRAKAGQKPEFEPGRGVPGSIFQSIQLAQGEIARASGISEASSATPPQGMTSGRALLALQEQDDSRMGPTIQLMETEFAAWGKAVLNMAKKYYEEPRKYAIAGEALSQSVFFFEKADLRDVKDVRCVPGSALPQNKLAKQQAVVELFTAGILGNPQDPEALARVRKMMEFGQTEDLFDDDALDEANAEKENVSMLERMQPEQVKLIDNHLVHLKTHLRRAKTVGVYDNPEIGMIFVAHIQMHQQAMNPQMQQIVQPGQADAMQQNQEQGPTPEGQPVATPATDSSGNVPAPSDQQIKPNDQGVTNENPTGS